MNSGFPEGSGGPGSPPGETPSTVSLLGRFSVRVDTAAGRATWTPVATRDANALHKRAFGKEDSVSDDPAVVQNSISVWTPEGTVGRNQFCGPQYTKNVFCAGVQVTNKWPGQIVRNVYIMITSMTPDSEDYRTLPETHDRVLPGLPAVTPSLADVKVLGRFYFGHLGLVGSGLETTDDVPKWIFRNPETPDGAGSDFTFDAQLYGERIPCAATPGVDLPDIAGVDSNCDGVDGQARNAIYVAPELGDDRNDGRSPVRPVATIEAALERARRRPGSQILVGGGTYGPADTLVLDGSTAGVFGGYGGAVGFVARGSSTSTRIESRAPVAAVATGDVTLSGLTLVAAPGNLASDGNSQALVVHGAAAAPAQVRLQNVALIAREGAEGAAGVAGSAGRAGSAGGGAQGQEPGARGAGCSAQAAGGAGGQGAPAEGMGADGEPAVGPGGGAGGKANRQSPDYQCGSASRPGGAGSDGASGALGASGSPAAATFIVDEGRVRRAPKGQSGSAGTSGAGGGGGGSGPAFYDDLGGNLCFGDAYAGAGGGGGGGGGCGGVGGTAGEHGGSSVALAVTRGRVSLEGVTLQRGSGGRGGKGGAGGAGGSGGEGGAGGKVVGSTPTEASLGGAGGRGGAGGSGGSGAGGNGGISACVVRDAGSSLVGELQCEGNQAPASGGAPSGAPGLVQEQIVMP